MRKNVTSPLLGFALSAVGIRQSRDKAEIGNQTGLGPESVVIRARREPVIQSAGDRLCEWGGFETTGGRNGRGPRESGDSVLRYLRVFLASCQCGSANCRGAQQGRGRHAYAGWRGPLRDLCQRRAGLQPEGAAPKLEARDRYPQHRGRRRGDRSGQALGGAPSGSGGARSLAFQRGDLIGRRAGRRSPPAGTRT